MLRSAKRTIFGAVIALVACGSSAATTRTADSHRHSGTVSVRVQFYGSNGNGAVTVFTGRGRRVARHVVHQSGAEPFVTTRFVLRPGSYTLKLRPDSGAWANCTRQVTVGVQARDTTHAWLGGPCSTY
jgi:hypothetical protein